MDAVADDAVTITHAVDGGDYGANSVTAAAVVVTVVENDTAVLSVAAIPPEGVPEDEGPAEFTVTLSTASSNTVTVDWATGDDTAGVTATAGDDYTSGSGSLTFAPGGALTQTVTVTLLDDAVDEPAESFTVTLSNAQHAELAGGGTTASATGKILDDDERAVTVAPTALSVSEGGVKQYTVELESEPTAAVTVAVTVPDGTDVSAGPTALTFTAADWETAQALTVTAAEDNDAVADPPVTITHAVAGGDYGANSVPADDVEVTVVENDTPVLSVVPDGDVQEDAGSATFTVKLSLASSNTVPVDWATADGTATAGSDYTAVTNGSLTFSPGGALSQTVTVTVTDDAVDEPDETFKVTLSNPRQATVGDGQGTAEAAIVDNDAAELSVASDGNVTEDAGSATFTVELSLASSRTVTVDWATADGTATAGSDYTAVTNGSLTFSPGGALSRTVTVTVTDDAVDEADETFTVTLSGAQHATLAGSGGNTATATIQDNDERGVTVAPTALTVVEGGSKPYTVELESEPTAAVTVTVAGGTDVTASPTELTFVASTWSTAQTVTVTAAEDMDAVTDAPVTIEHAVAGGDYGANSVTAADVVVTVVENDTPVLSVESDGSVQEDAGSATFTVKLRPGEQPDGDGGLGDGGRDRDGGVGLHGGEREADVQSGRRAEPDGDGGGDRRHGGRSERDVRCDAEQPPAGGARRHGNDDLRGRDDRGR